MKKISNSALKDIKEEEYGRCIYAIYFNGYCDDESFKVRVFHSSSRLYVENFSIEKVANCVDESDNPIQINTDYIDEIDDAILDKLIEDDGLTKSFVAKCVKDCYLSSSPRSEIMYFYNYSLMIKAFTYISIHYSDFIDLIHEITDNDNKDIDIFDWKLELNSRERLYLLEFNNFTLSFHVKLCLVQAINGDKIECDVHDVFPYNYDKSVTISPNDIAEVLIANSVFEGRYSSSAARSRVTKAMAEANPNKNEFVPLLYYLNKDRAYVEMGKRLNTLNFGKDMTPMMHELDYSELDKWLDGTSYLLKRMLKYDKDVDRYDLQSYVYRKIGEAFDTYKDLPNA